MFPSLDFFSFDFCHLPGKFLSFLAQLFFDDSISFSFCSFGLGHQLLGALDLQVRFLQIGIQGFGSYVGLKDLV